MAGCWVCHNFHVVNVDGSKLSVSPVRGPRIAAACSWLQRLSVSRSYMTRLSFQSKPETPKTVSRPPTDRRATTPLPHRGQYVTNIGSSSVSLTASCQDSTERGYARGWFPRLIPMTRLPAANRGSTDSRSGADATVIERPSQSDANAGSTMAGISFRGSARYNSELGTGSPGLGDDEEFAELCSSRVVSVDAETQPVSEPSPLAAVRERYARRFTPAICTILDY